MNLQHGRTIHKDTDREFWTVGLFAVLGIVVTALVMMAALDPNAGKLSSDIAQAEFPVIRPFVDRADTLPSLPQSAHLDVRR